MNRSSGSILLSVFAVLCLFGVKFYFHEQAERKAMDDLVAAKLSHDIQVPLDCPPFGQLKVTFNVEGGPQDAAAFNLPHIVEQWGNIWPKVYGGVNAETSNWKLEEKEKLSQNLEVQVDLPSAVIENKVDWQIEYSCADGYFITEFTGFTARDTYIGN